MWFLIKNKVAIFLGMSILKWLALSTMGRPSRPRFGRRGQLNTGFSGEAGRPRYVNMSLMNNTHDQCFIENKDTEGGDFGENASLFPLDK